MARQSPDAKADAPQLQNILDLSLKATTNTDQIRRDAAAKEAEYRKRRDNAMRRARIESHCLEASRKDSVIGEDIPPRKERQTEAHQAGRRSMVYDTKSPL